MRIPLVFSFGFHIAVFLFAMYGLPSSSKSIVMDHQVIDVELVPMTKAPELKPVPPPKKMKPPPPRPPEPLNKVAALPPKPMPESKPETASKPVKKKIKPKPKVKKKLKPATKPLAPRPKPRPAPDFASMMLKTVQKLKDTPSPKSEKTKKSKKSFDQKMAALMKRQPRPASKRAPLGEKLSISEYGAIRRQIERCWLVPAAIGAKNVEDIEVQIKMKLNPDGTLRAARIVDRFRMETNLTYKAVAESALRAVRNPQCNKFNLPLKKYDIWKDMVVTFSPSEMVGR
ncbi:MAG: cell envelope integrity protein TolA [Pseudomonadota bacterium]|nr:cell envelope integrity protein TolA [Pseudomonadota bacterium]